MFGAQHRPAFGPRQLHQLFGEAGQAFQLRLDHGGPLAQRTFRAFGDQTLGLRQSGCDRRAQFMGGVGGKTPLRFQCAFQAGHQAVGGLLDRDQFRAQAGQGERRQIIRPLQAQGHRQMRQGPQAALDPQRYTHQRQRQQHTQRHQHRQHRLAQGGLPMGQGFGHLNGVLARHGGPAVNPVTGGGKKPLGLDLIKDFRVSVMREHQHFARGVAHIIGDMFVLFLDRQDALSGNAVARRDQLNHRQRQNAFAGFLQGGVKAFVNLAAHDIGTGDNRTQPQHH